MFSPLRDPAQLAASPIGAPGAPADTVLAARNGGVPADRVLAFGVPSDGVAPDGVPAPFAGWRASLRRALDVTVAFTTLESYTADDVLRSFAGSADAAPSAGASPLDAARTAGGPRSRPASSRGSSSRPAPSRPASSRERRAHAGAPAEHHCTTPLPGGPRTPRTSPSTRQAPATAAARRAG